MSQATSNLAGKTTEFIIGADVWCIDAVCGHLRRVVVDPVTRAVTHLVIDSGHRQVNSHLVPIELVDLKAKANQLRCTLAEFEETEDARETRLLAGMRGQWRYGQGSILSAPNSGGMSVNGMGDLGGMDMGGIGNDPKYVAYDRLPEGGIDIRRGDEVQATDGPVGQVHGLVVSSSDHGIARVLLDESNFWGPKEIAIPISAVTEINDGIQLNLSKDEVRQLPLADADRRA